MSLGATYSTASMGTEASMRRSRVRTCNANTVYTTPLQYVA